MALQLSMGRNVFKNPEGLREKIFFIEKMSYGVIALIAKARYGKSCILNILMAKMSRYRKLIIFDYRGEHKLNRYANFMSKDDIQPIERMKIIENFGFKITDFTTESGWISLGFTEASAAIMTELVKIPEAYDIKKFYLMVADAGNWLSSERNSETFFAKYPSLVDKIPSRVSPSTLQNLSTWFSLIYNKGFFLKDDDDRIYIEDWCDLLKDNNNYLINLNLTDSTANFARAMVGKILEDMQSHDCMYLKSSNPVIITEEADLVYPSVKQDQEIPSSCKFAELYCLKYQKFGVEMFFVCQDMTKLYSPIISNVQTWILGHCRVSSESQLSGNIQEKVNSLRWMPLSNYRQFLMISEGSRAYTFEPEDVCCWSHGLKTGYNRFSSGRFHSVFEQFGID